MEWIIDWEVACHCSTHRAWCLLWVRNMVRLAPVTCRFVNCTKYAKQACVTYPTGSFGSRISCQQFLFITRDGASGVWAAMRGKTRVRVDPSWTGNNSAYVYRIPRDRRNLVVMKTCAKSFENHELSWVSHWRNARRATSTNDLTSTTFRQNQWNLELHRPSGASYFRERLKALNCDWLSETLDGTWPFRSSKLWIVVATPIQVQTNNDGNDQQTNWRRLGSAIWIHDLRQLTLKENRKRNSSREKGLIQQSNYLSAICSPFATALKVLNQSSV